jgi:hypothetical protein
LKSIHYQEEDQKFHTHLEKKNLAGLKTENTLTEVLKMHPIFPKKLYQICIVIFLEMMLVKVFSKMRTALFYNLLVSIIKMKYGSRCALFTLLSSFEV